MKEKEIIALADYGHNVGMAFQIKDDCLDLIGSEKTMGKPRGRDLIGGKVTLPLIYTFQRIPNKERERIQSVFNERTIGADDLPWILEKMKATEGLDDAVGKAQSFVETSKENLDALPNSGIKETLLQLADFTVDRSS